jgi:hypothetical protein
MTQSQMETILAVLGDDGRSAAMDSEISTQPTRQFSIASILIVVAAIAGVLGLANFWSERGGLYLAIPAATIPFAFVVEFALRLSAPESSHAAQTSRFGLRLLVIGVASTLPAILGWIGLLDQGAWWSPCPYLMFVSYAYLEPWLMHGPYLLYAVPSTAFLVLMLPTANSTSHRLPTRSLAILGVASLSTCYWFCSSVGNAFDYQSTRYIIGTIAVNACCVLALWVTWWMLRQRFNFASVVAWNVALVGWLFWLAFPWLGEYI